MATLALKNVAGKDAGTIELDDELFAVQPNVPVMHQVVTAQLAARRSGTQSAKTRAEVSGGGRKPYAQKGTGNARQGSIRAPHFSGGGVAHGPKPRKYDQKTPKKMVKLALRSALSDRASEGKIVVVDSWGIDAPKTKTAKQALDALGIDGTALVVVGRDDAAAAMSFRNLPKVQLIGPGELNAYDVLCNEWIVFTKDVLPAAVAADQAAAKPTRPEKPSKPAEGSASDEAEAARVGSAADDESATQKGSASDEAEAARVGSAADDESATQKGSASDEAEAAQGGSAADAEPATKQGSHAANDDGSEPEGFPIKGNADSMLYHVPDSRFYNQTVAEVWFATEEAAEAAGFSKPAGATKKDED
jgi:large subunit ribosomal protein L4